MPIETETVFSGFPTGKKDEKGKLNPLVQGVIEEGLD